MRTRGLALLGLACCSVDMALGDTFSAADIYQKFGPSVAKVDFVGELFDGSKESSFGTAFLVSEDGLALTCDHVIPPETNYKSSTVHARFHSLNGMPVEGKVVWRNRELDIAIVKFKRPEDAAPLVLSGTRAAALTPGTPVTTLAFPIDLDLGVWSGKTNTREPKRPRWVMDAVLNPGASGSPIFTSDGLIVGVAWGAAIRWTNGNASAPLEGIRYFVSSESIWNSMPLEQRALLSTTVTIPQALDSSTLRVASTIDVTKSDHPVAFGPHRRPFEIALQANPGYQIVSVSSSVFSAANMSGYRIELAPDGRSAVAKFDLTSGPIIDRWRGWLKGTVQLEQKRLQ